MRHAGSIPTLQARQIIPEYIKSLTKDGRLDMRDQAFLHDDLLPQMISDERTQQALTQTQIDQAPA